MISPSVMTLHTRAFSRLSNAYASGRIVYPRVENSYLPTMRETGIEAHAPLDTFDVFSLPLKQENYKLTKETVPLLLLNARISTPASILSILKFINRLYGDDMSVEVGMRDKIHDTVSRVDEHIQMLKKDKRMAALTNKTDTNFLHTIPLFIGDGNVAKKQRHLFVHEYALDPERISIFGSKKKKMSRRKDTKDNFIIEKTAQRNMIHESLENLIRTMRKRTLLLEQEVCKKAIKATVSANRVRRGLAL